MSDTARGSVSDYTSIDVGEQQIWASIYRTIGDPAVAAEVIEYFDREVNMKPYCPALYLRAKQTLRRDHQKTLRAERIGGFVRWTGRSLAPGSSYSSAGAPSAGVTGGEPNADVKVPLNPKRALTPRCALARH